MLGVHPATTVRGALLRLGPATNLELVEYTSPDAAAAPPRTADPGAVQLALFVDDIEMAAAHLAEQDGVHVLGAPSVVPEGQPHAGQRQLFATTPIGILLELLTRDELPYTRDTDLRLWGPAPAWTNRDA